MILNTISLLKSINKAYLKEKVSRYNIEIFKEELLTLFDKSSHSQSEDTLKDYVTEFLRNSWYNPEYAITINNERKDLAIHSGKSVKDPIGVISEIKKTGSAEMITTAKPNTKAFHELVLYYLDERISNKNNSIKHLIATDVRSWIVFDANEFDKKIYGNSRIKKLYDLKQNDKKDNPFFYDELKKILAESNSSFTATFFSLEDFKKIIKNEDTDDDKKLVALYKILSPAHLLKLPFNNDSNSLDKGFYAELLHIIGLEEVKEGSKKLIQRKKISSEASLIENAIIKINDKDCLRDIVEITKYGSTKEEQSYNIALELCITWINRILFLKLLEAQLFAYHNSNKKYLFLDTNNISDFDELNNLFYQVLAEKQDLRRERLQRKFANVPYLNSSLFERTDLERKTIDISALDNSLVLPFYEKTVLKDTLGKKLTSSVTTLEYLFSFLDSYDFTSEGNASIQEQNKTLINASVLGLIFEKINGYKDGSFFTPGFITMFMCRETLRRTVIQKFNESYKWNCKNFQELQDRIEFTDKQKRQEANDLINTITICDPAVGSGHFLVSALNELITIKHDLRILQYRHNYQRIKEYNIDIVSDELILQDIETEELFEYTLNEKGHIKPELQAIQETLFHEKETLIENCLFGVDINPNSVKICRLRLWIELLKNAYYTKETGYTQLETLPNIDINIKQGNSLVSRFSLEEDLSGVISKSKWGTIESYKVAVQTYRNAQSKEEKREMEALIENIKKDFRSTISWNDPINKKLNKLRGELSQLQQTDLFSQDIKKKLKANKELEKISSQIDRLEKEKEEIRNNAIYKDAFEWRFEFPDVLDDNGTFVGFNAIVGNPPYIQLQKMSADSDVLAKMRFKTFTKTGDVYQLFYELGVNLLKPKGLLGFITSNKWMRTDYGSTTRKFLSEECNTLLVVDFGMAQMFNAATTYTNILLLSKDDPGDNIKMCRIKEDYDSTTLLEDYIDFASVEMSNPMEGSWIAYDKLQYELIKKIVAQGKELKHWDIQINRGILTGYNNAFIIDTKTRNELVNEDPKSSEIIVKILRGEDIKSYKEDWADKWLINTHNGVKGTEISRIDVKNYPAVYRWLSKFEKELIKRLDKGDHWSNLRNCAYLQEFYKPKIIYPNMTKFLPFVYDKHQFFCNQKCFIITGKYLGFLTAFFNSKLFRFAFKDYFPELLGDTRELSKVFFETVSVKELSDAKAAEFDVLVEEIQKLKSNSKEIDLLIRKVDEKLYELYSLSEYERALVNGSESYFSPIDLRINERSDSVIS